MRFVASSVPGIDMPAELVRRVESAVDAEAECFEIAYELADHAMSQPGVAGLHFISFRKDAGIAKLCARLGIPEPNRKERHMDTVLRSRSASRHDRRRAAVLRDRRADQPDRSQGVRRGAAGGDLSTVTADALAQVKAGADMLDVNAGIPLVDEPELLKAMLRTVQDAVDAPICIDSSVIEALEAGLSVYEGRALVNSVTAEDERLEEILPLVAKHDAAVIGLANDETGIPETPQKRLECARKIVSVANDYGIKTEDVIIDPLAMTVGADTEAVTTTLATISLIRDELGVNMCLGASNVSFGLPQRHVLNAGFPADGDGGRTDQRDHVDRRGLRQNVRAADLLLGHDPWGASWIAAHRAARSRRAGGGAGVSAKPLSDAERRASAEVAPDDGAARVRLRFDARRHRGAGARAAPRSSTPPAGTGSRSTRPAAATAPARSARSRSSPATSRSARSTRARSRPTSSPTAGGWRAARARASDLVVQVPPLQTRPKAALVGVGRHVILRPSVQKRHLVIESRRWRISARICSACSTGSTISSRTIDRGCCASSGRRCAPRSSTSPRSSATEELIALEPGDTTARRYAIAFDLGTTTVVATLLDLDNGQPAAVRSMLNRQQPYGADVITRISATMMDSGALQALRDRAHETLAELDRRGAAPRPTSRRARSTRSPSAGTSR